MEISLNRENKTFSQVFKRPVRYGGKMSKGKNVENKNNSNVNE
jgi:hypothetical protein